MLWLEILFGLPGLAAELYILGKQLPVRLIT
jgi:hypothetical protein